MRTFHITENGFSIDSDKVAIPECYVEAESFIDAVSTLDTYLNTKIKSDRIKLVTPESRIDFKTHEKP
jgi:hypothetical protein